MKKQVYNETMARTPPTPKNTINTRTNNHNIHRTENTMHDEENNIHQTSHPFCENYDISSKILLEIKSVDIFLAAKNKFIDLNSCIKCIDLYYNWREKVFSANQKFNENSKESKQEIKLNRIQTRKNYKHFFLKLDIYRIILGSNDFIVYEISKYNWKLLKNNCMRTQFFYKLNELSNNEIYNIFNNEEIKFPIELLYFSKSLRVKEIAERIINQRIFKNSIIYKAYLSIHNFCIDCDSPGKHKNNCVLFDINNKETRAEEPSKYILKNTVDLYIYLSSFWKKGESLRKNSSNGEDIIDYENITTTEILTIVINTITLHDYVTEDILYLFDRYKGYKEQERCFVYLIFISFLSKLDNKTFVNYEVLFNNIKETTNIKGKMNHRKFIKEFTRKYKNILSEGIMFINQGIHLNYVPKIMNIVEFLTNYDLLVPYLQSIYNPSFRNILLFDLIQIFSFSTYLSLEKDSKYLTYMSSEKEMIDNFLCSLVKEKVQLNNQLKDKTVFNKLQGKIFYAIFKSGIHSILINLLLKTYKKQCNSCDLLFPDIYNIIYDLIRGNKTIVLNGLTIPVFDIRIINTIITIQSHKIIEKLIFMFDKYFQLFIRRRNINILFLTIKGLYEVLSKATELNITQIMNLNMFFKLDYTTFISSIQTINKNKISILYKNRTLYDFDNEDHLKSQILEIYRQSKLLFTELIRYYYIELNTANIEMFVKFEDIILTQSFFIKDKIEKHRRPYVFINYTINELRYVCFRNSLYNNLLRRIYKTHSIRKQPEDLQNKNIKPILSLNTIFVDSIKVINKSQIITVNNDIDSISQYLADTDPHTDFLTNNLLVNQEKYFLLKLKIIEIQNSKSFYSLKYSERANGILLYETINLFNYLIAEINNYILFHKNIPELLIIIISILSKSDLVVFPVYLNILSILVLMEDKNIEKFLIQTFLRVENIENIFDYEIFFTVLKKTSNSSKFINEMFYQICLLISEKKLKNKNCYTILQKELDRIDMKRVYKKIERNFSKSKFKKDHFLNYDLQELSTTTNIENCRNSKDIPFKYEFKISHSLKVNQKDIAGFVHLFLKTRIKPESPMQKLSNKQIVAEFHEANEKYLKKYVSEKGGSDSSTSLDSQYTSSSIEESGNVSNEEIKSLFQVKLESSDTEQAEIIKVKKVLDVFWQPESSSESGDVKDTKSDEIKKGDISISESHSWPTDDELSFEKNEDNLPTRNIPGEVEGIEKDVQNDELCNSTIPQKDDTTNEEKCVFDEKELIEESNLSSLRQINLTEEVSNQLTLENTNSNREVSNDLNLYFDQKPETTKDAVFVEEALQEAEVEEIQEEALQEIPKKDETQKKDKEEYESKETIKILTNTLMEQQKSVISENLSEEITPNTKKSELTKLTKEELEISERPPENTTPMTPTPLKRVKLTEPHEKSTENYEKIINEIKVIPKREAQIIDISKKLIEKRQNIANEVFNPHQIMQKFDIQYFVNFILNISISNPMKPKSIDLLKDFETFEEFFETYKMFIFIETVYSLISNLMEYNPIMDWRYLNTETHPEDPFKYKFITEETEIIQLNGIVLFTNEELIISKNRIQYLKKPNVDEDILELQELFNIDSHSKFNLFNSGKQLETRNRDYTLGVIQSSITLNGKTIITILTQKPLQFIPNLTKILLIMNISSTLKELKSLYHLSSNKLINLIMKPSLIQSQDTIKSNYLDKIDDNQIYNTLSKIKDVFKLNDSQKMAIANCLSNDVFTLIQGPPGTGKSSTIIALTYLLVNMGLRIMISAASNTAVDHITRLIHNNDNFKDKIITRFGIINSVSDDIKPLMPGYLTNSERIKNKLTGKILTNQYLKNKTKILYETSQIFTSTLNSSYSKELVNKIDVLIVDEVCQAVDTSLFVSINLKPKKVILIGDPKQLPPTIISGSKSYETTVFSRFCQFQPVNLLNIQYRMNPDISKFPSEYFYNNRLENGISDETYQEVLQTVSIPYFPCSFIHVSGSEIHSFNSFYNQTEIDVSIHLITKIYSNPKNRDRTIGLITPYSAQVNKLRERVNALSVNNRMNIQISTVDGFQGQEKDFIIFSTVRTEKIGFLRDERRINVAFTRAKYGFCVLGNRKALQSEVWLRFYEYAKSKGKLFKS